MDYFVGGVAALISGDVTPNRPRLAKTALTPIKHKPSPNITPKSAIIKDRSALLSPSVQKKKALVKKSPKRIFQNPDMNVTDDGQVLPSPKGEKAKKHLKNHLGGEENESITKDGVKIKKDKGKNDNVKENSQNNLGKTPKKNKNKKSKLDEGKNVASDLVNLSSSESPSKLDANEHNGETSDVHTAKSSSDTKVVKKINKKNKKKNLKLQHNKTEKISVLNQPTKIVEEQEKMEINPDSEAEGETIPELPKKNKKKKGKKNIVVEEQEKMEINPDSEAEEETIPKLPKKNKKKKGKKNIVNPNAVTNKDTDSEHESDGESLESEDEMNNKEVLEAKDGESSEEEDEAKEQEIKKVEKPESDRDIKEELNRTIFIGNVPFSTKSKKQIKKIFRKHGEIDSLRIRSVPVKDPTVTPKLAVIKGEIHPERSTVNVYVKYKDAASVDSALTENNVVLDGMHLRVSRSEISNLENDPNCAVFVGNLPLALEDEALWSKFENCGEIKSVRIIRDRKTGCGKGFGYVNFTSKDGVELALAMSEEDLTIKNRILRVKRISQLLPKKVQKKATGHKKNENNTSSNIQSRNQGGKRFLNRNQNGGKFQNGNQDGNRFQNRNQGGNGFQNRNQSGNSFQNRNQGGFQNRNQGGFQNRNQGGFQNRNQGSFQNRNQGGNGFQNRNQGGNSFQNRNQGGNKRPFASRQFGNGDQDQTNERRPFGQRNGATGNGSYMKQPEDGAHRRMANKRKSQESSSEAPPSKRPKEDQPRKEKKPKKEFVGVTAEKKKKKKQDKGQKKKKALSEILTKS